MELLRHVRCLEAVLLHPIVTQSKAEARQGCGMRCITLPSACTLRQVRAHHLHAQKGNHPEFRTPHSQQRILTCSSRVSTLK